jgi:hypothetical protein
MFRGFTRWLVLVLEIYPFNLILAGFFNVLTDLEFKIIYVGSAETYEFDQVLDQIVVDAVPQGQFKFMFQVCILI